MIYKNLALTYSVKCGRALATIVTHGNNTSFGHITILYTGDFWKEALSDEQRMEALSILATFNGKPFVVMNPVVKGTCVRFKSPELAVIRQALLEGPFKNVANAREGDRDPEMDDFHTQVTDHDHVGELQTRANYSGILENGKVFTFCSATGYKPKEIVLERKKKSDSGPMRDNRSFGKYRNTPLANGGHSLDDLRDWTEPWASK